MHPTMGYIWNSLQFGTDCKLHLHAKQRTKHACVQKPEGVKLTAHFCWSIPVGSQKLQKEYPKGKYHLDDVGNEFKVTKLAWEVAQCHSWYILEYNMSLSFKSWLGRKFPDLHSTEEITITLFINRQHSNEVESFGNLPKVTFKHAKWMTSI